MRPAKYKLVPQDSYFITNQGKNKKTSHATSYSYKHRWNESKVEACGAKYPGHVLQGRQEKHKGTV